MFPKPKLILTLCILLTGCARLVDTPKVIWGSSTRALEEARAEAISKTYRCGFNDCYDAVLSLAYGKNNKKPVVEEMDAFIVQTGREGVFHVFIENRKKRHIVVMGIKGSVDTTEVGIFFSQPTLTTTQIEVTSLSSSAKRAVSEKVFEELSSRFPESQ